MLAMFIGSYFLSWTFFAILCYMVAFSHGDLMFDEVTGERLGEGKDPCIIGVYDFTSMFVYSIETQTTIGFGEKYPSEECPETMFLFILQIIVSIAIEGGMISIIYAKTARPAKQLTKLKFSDKAVVCNDLTNEFSRTNFHFANRFVIVMVNFVYSFESVIPGNNKP